MCGRLTYRSSEGVDPLTPPRTRSRPRERYPAERTPRLLRLLLPPRSPSLPIRLGRTRRRSTIGTRGTPGNLETPPPRPPESTRPRSEIKRRRRRRGTQVGSPVSIATNWDTTQTSVRSPGGQKTSIGLDDLHVDDWS